MWFQVMNIFINHRQVAHTLMNAVDPQPMMKARLNLVEDGMVDGKVIDGIDSSRSPGRSYRQ